MQAADLFAATGAAALGMLALLHGMVWRAQRQRWSLLFAATMALGALYFLFDPWLRPGAGVGGRPNPAGSLLGALLILALLRAMIEYVGLPTRVGRVLMAAAVGAGVVLLALRLGGWMPRVGGFLSYAAYFLLLAAVAAWGWRHEPGRGHGVVLAALLLYPLTVLLSLAGHLSADLVRYAIVVPTAMLGMTVLTTGQMRARDAMEQEVQRRRAAEAELRALNDSLEHRVQARTAELQAMVQGLESFNRSVSHDLRGPLGGMAHALRLTQEALERGDLATVRRFVDTVAGQAEDSAALVQAMLALARAGKGELQREPLQPVQVVQDALAQVAATQHAPGDAAPLPVTVHALPPVTADPGLLRQVFVNLVDNALKFSREARAPQVEVGATLQQGQTVFFVRDNGVGFESAATDGARLFEPFERLHGTRFPGTGVGLSIVKRIVERHGGRLWAESVPGRGATFHFTLEPGAAGPTVQG